MPSCEVGPPRGGEVTVGGCRVRNSTVQWPRPCEAQVACVTEGTAEVAGAAAAAPAGDEQASGGLGPPPRPAAGQ
eukprot:13349237-Alexandrium_andersonii.AAC.1